MDTSSQAVQEEKSLTDDLAAAWAAAEAESTEEEDTLDAAESVDPVPEDAPDADDGEESELTAAMDAADEKDKQAADSRDKAAADVEAKDKSAPPANDLDKPPVGLPPAAREAWKDTPVAIREALAKRERDFANGIKQYAENAKRAEMMDRTIAPFQQYFAMQNQPPSQTVSQLLQTASILQMGSPQQKAGMVANLINQFGVDIETLDNVLSGSNQGGQPRQPQGQPQQQQLGPQQIQQLLDQEFRKREMAMLDTRVQSDVQAFATDPENEFYKDVANDMADILEISAKRGIDLSLKDAYKRACAMNPEISNIIAQREAEKQRSARQRAAASVSGAPGAPAGSHEPGSIREALEAAWDGVGRT